MRRFWPTAGGAVNWSVNTMRLHLLPKVIHDPIHPNDPYSEDIWFFGWLHWCLIRSWSPDMVEYEL